MTDEQLQLAELTMKYKLKLDRQKAHHSQAQLITNQPICMD
jgi:hypothetical protein